MSIRKSILSLPLALVITLALSWSLQAQIPAGYYNSAAGLTGYPLKTALYNIIKDHTVISYNNLYNYYPKTDFKPGNVVWDIYSDVPGGTPAYIYHHTSGDQCGTYNSEGDCYNREHSMPASWFADASPMYSDLFNVIPTDGYVNNRRSNYPYAEVGTPDWTSTNGTKLGDCSFPGWIYTVFEPIDEYKGDVARTMFYMATRYENLIADWKTNPGASCVIAGNSTSVYWPWYINQLIKWHEQDSVSARERARNDSVYKIQDNRNPYIDHPEWVGEIWTSTLGKADPASMPSPLQLFPNPAHDQLNIVLAGSDEAPFCITDLCGRTIIRGICHASAPIDISALQPGIYLVVVSESQFVRTARVSVSD
jgi:endonuclease I